MDKKTVLITGGCGFLGQYLVNDLLKEFSDIFIKIIDLKSNSMAIFNHKKNARVEILLNKDICNYNSIKDDFKNIDTVIHLAGIVSFSLKDKDLLEKVNVCGTKNVVRAANENKISNLVHISSVAALGYNDDQNNPIDEEFKFNWGIAESKRKYYMLTKHLADVAVNKGSKVNSLILYPGLMFGPGDVTNSVRLIKAIKYGKIPFNMPGGTNIVDVRDVSKGIIKAIKNKITDGHYLLSGYNLEFLDINKRIAKQLSVIPPNHQLPRILNPIMFGLLLFMERISKNKLELTADNIDSAFKFRYFSNNKAKTRFNWRPKISFEQTIKDTIDWMNKNDMFEK
ncbi:MAG: NAD-dependent epimerase/dehydratase family protein [Nanoarchaeota archaeon]